MDDIPQELLSRAAAGDRTAFKALYDASAGFVYAVALRVIHNRTDAEEVTQDVFIRIYRGLKDFEGRSSFKSWVYRVTMNTAFNYLRKESKFQKNRTEDDFAAVSQAVVPEAGGEIEAEDREKKVQVLLARLSPDLRACLVLREIQELSYREIADSLKCNINTVRTRLKRARESLIRHARKGVISNEV